MRSGTHSRARALQGCRPRCEAAFQVFCNYKCRARKSRLNECLPASTSPLWLCAEYSLHPLLSFLCEAASAIEQRRDTEAPRKPNRENGPESSFIYLFSPFVFYQSNVPALVEQDSQLDPELGSTPRTSTGPRHRRLDLGPRDPLDP